MTVKRKKKLLRKNEMVRRLTDEINNGLGRRLFQRSHTAVFLEALKEVVVDTLKEGKGMRLGFISFDVAEVEARRRYNPRKKTHYDTPTHLRVKALIPAELRKIGRTGMEPAKEE